VKKYHPDRFVGKSTREMETAENRFIEIQKAYDLINETS
jgi:DnaJ-class molecular chaperone